MISDQRLLIISTQPQLEKQVVALVGRQRGQNKRLERDGMTGRRKGWKDSRGRRTGRQGRQHLKGLDGGQI